jgi:hypothetical protein
LIVNWSVGERRIVYAAVGTRAVVIIERDTKRSVTYRLAG